MKIVTFISLLAPCHLLCSSTLLLLPPRAFLPPPQVTDGEHDLCHTAQREEGSQQKWLSIDENISEDVKVLQCRRAATLSQMAQLSLMRSWKRLLAKA